MAKLLLVEDDELASQAITDAMTFEQHSVERVATGREAINMARAFGFDLVILDWMLPDMPGPAVCKELRNYKLDTPILMLTGRGTLDDKEVGFNAGADDYLTKPFASRELALRVRALLRRPPGLIEDQVSIQNIVVDFKAKRVLKDNVEVNLYPKEFAILEFLVRNKSRVFSLDELLSNVWQSESESSHDAVRQCIRRLRQKVDTPSQPSIITTVLNLGYRVDF